MAPTDPIDAIANLALGMPADFAVTRRLLGDVHGMLSEADKSVEYPAINLMPPIIAALSRLEARIIELEKNS